MTKYEVQYDDPKMVGMKFVLVVPASNPLEAINYIRSLGYAPTRYRDLKALQSTAIVNVSQLQLELKMRAA